MRFRERLYRFMQGRNGVDALAKCLNKLSFGCLIVAILFTFISVVCLRHAAPTGALVFRILYYVTYGIGLFIDGTVDLPCVFEEHCKASERKHAVSVPCTEMRTQICFAEAALEGSQNIQVLSLSAVQANDPRAAA